MADSVNLGCKTLVRDGTGEMPERIAAIVEARKLDAAVPGVKQ